MPQQIVFLLNKCILSELKNTKFAAQFIGRVAQLDRASAF